MDINTPFLRLVAIMIKFSLAAIPAMFIVSLLLAVIMRFSGGIMSASNWMSMHSDPM